MAFQSITLKWTPLIIYAVSERDGVISVQHQIVERAALIG